MVEATPSAADCEDLAKAKEACLAEGGVSSNFQRASTISTSLTLLASGLQCPHGRLPEVHGGVEGGGGLSLRSLLAVEPQCKYSSQMFALGSPTSANIHPDFYVSIVPAFAIYMQTISNKYYVLTYHMFYSI